MHANTSRSIIFIKHPPRPAPARLRSPSLPLPVVSLHIISGGRHCILARDHTIHHLFDSYTMPPQSRDLLHLYRRILRSCATYPSKNRWGMYKAIQEEFRDNATMDPDDPKTQQQIQVAYKGLGQLQLYDTMKLSKGNPNNPNWEVTLEQNPMPKPPER